MSNEKCPGCGHVHVMPFSETTRALAKKILESENAEERHALTLELADTYADEANWTDLTLPEELHKLTKRHLRYKADSYAASMELGRLLVRLNAAIEAHRQSSSPDLKVTPFGPVTKEDVGPN